MTLRRQLLIAGLLTVLIPWASFLFVTQLDAALRAREMDTLSQQAAQMAFFLQNQPAVAALQPVQPGQRVLYAEPLDHALILDGYADDWPGAHGEAMPPLHDAGQGIFWQAATDDNHLFLLIVVHTDKVLYMQPDTPESPHEEIRLSWGAPDHPTQRWLQTSAPGPVRGEVRDRPNPATADTDIRGFWQSTPTGYTVELQLPLPAAGTPFGFTVLRPDQDGTLMSLGQEGLENQTLPRLEYARANLLQALHPFLQSGETVQLVQRDGWLLSSAQRPVPDETTDVTDWRPLQILEKIMLNGLRMLLATQQPAGFPLDDNGSRLSSPLFTRALQEHRAVHATTRSAPDDDAMLTAVAPVSIGADQALLVIRHSVNDLLSLSSQTLGHVLSRSLLLMMALLLILLGYASWLSWRITRLRRQVAATVDEDGRVIGYLKPSRHKDEVGDLSRQFARLVDNLKHYTDYLESFASKLSHELKTPLAVVRSSLDNLKHTEPTKEQHPYIERALQGTDRLSRILQAMSEASRLEQSIAHAEPELFDLSEVLGMATQAYQSLDPGHRILYRGPTGACTMSGAPELIVQMLDKLVDNARDFTPAGGLIEVRLQQKDGTLVLEVDNEGPPLPERMTRDIFGAFVSIRNQGDDGHLGQGLLIVKLIADFHRGQASARNRPDGRGAIFRIRLPALH